MYRHEFIIKSDGQLSQEQVDTITHVLRAIALYECGNAVVGSSVNQSLELPEDKY